MLTKYSIGILVSLMALFAGCTKSSNSPTPFQAACSSAIPGDANRDCTVDTQDAFAIFRAGKYSTGAAATWAEGDFDADGKVTSRDLKTLTAALHPNRIGDCDGDGIISHEDKQKLAQNTTANKQPALRSDCDFVGPNGQPDGKVSSLDLAALFTSGLLPDDTDLNVDGKTDYLDVIQIYAAGKLNTGNPASSAEGDVTGDLTVDASDLAQFSSIK